MKTSLSQKRAFLQAQGVLKGLPGGFMATIQTVMCDDFLTRPKEICDLVLAGFPHAIVDVEGCSVALTAEYVSNTQKSVDLQTLVTVEFVETFKIAASGLYVAIYIDQTNRITMAPLAFVDPNGNPSLTTIHEVGSINGSIQLGNSIIDYAVNAIQNTNYAPNEFDVESDCFDSVTIDGSSKKQTWHRVWEVLSRVWIPARE